MTTSFCLAIDVKSDHIKGGIGYLISFRLPVGTSGNPENLPEFAAWRDKVRQAVLDAGDDPFDTDGYTKKLTVAELMHDIMRINREFGIQIGGVDGMPAVQIQSSNPHDLKIDIGFSEKEGRFRVTERQPRETSDNMQISRHGDTRIVAGTARQFPFIKTPPAFKSLRKPFAPGF